MRVGLKSGPVLSIVERSYQSMHVTFFLTNAGNDASDIYPYRRRRNSSLLEALSTS